MTATSAVPLADVDVEGLRNRLEAVRAEGETLDDLALPTLRVLAKWAGLTGVGKTKKADLAALLKARIVDLAAAQNPEGEHDDGVDDCIACAAGLAVLPERTPYAPLPEELTTGLTVWNNGFAAQMSLEVEQLLDVLDDDGEPTGEQTPGPPVGCLYVHLDPALPRLPAPDDPEDVVAEDRTGPVRLDREQARALRDLLNIATARGFL